MTTHSNQATSSHKFILSVDELLDYEDRILSGSIDFITVRFDWQVFFIFPVDNRPGIVVAWPTIDGKLTGLPEDGEVFLSLDNDLFYNMKPKLPDSIKMMVFPTYGD